MGDLLRKLGSKEEPFRDDLAPPLDGRATRGAVERGVYLDRRVVPGVLGEPGARRDTLGVERALPVRVRPSRCAEVQSRLWWCDPAGVLGEETLLLRFVHALQERGCYHRAGLGFAKALPTRIRRMYYSSALCSYEGSKLEGFLQRPFRAPPATGSPFPDGQVLDAAREGGGVGRLRTRRDARAASRSRKRRYCGLTKKRISGA